MPMRDLAVAAIKIVVAAYLGYTGYLQGEGNTEGP